MNIDLDHNEAELDPWDLKATIGGVEYPTRPMTVADLQMFEDIDAGRVKDMRAMMAFMLSFFPHEKPDLSQVPCELLGILFQQINAHTRERLANYQRRHMSGKSGNRRFLECMGRMFGRHGVHGVLPGQAVVVRD
jgi:hypothetical protein